MTIDVGQRLVAGGTWRRRKKVEGIWSDMKIYIYLLIEGIVLGCFFLYNSFIVLLVIVDVDLHEQGIIRALKDEKEKSASSAMSSIDS
jgi:hypothetical protein